MPRRATAKGPPENDCRSYSASRNARPVIALTRLPKGARVLPATGHKHLEPPIMSMFAVLSIRHHPHVCDDTLRLDKAVSQWSHCRGCAGMPCRDRGRLDQGLDSRRLCACQPELR